MTYGRHFFRESDSVRLTRLIHDLPHIRPSSAVEISADFYRREYGIKQADSRKIEVVLESFRRQNYILPRR